MCIRDRIETDDQEAHRKIEEKDDILKLYQHVESKLSTRERLVLKMRYGLYNEEEYTPVSYTHLDVYKRQTIACASTVAVVVPSPATSFVLDATSLMI